MVNSKVQGTVSTVHLCRTVTSEFFVVHYWTMLFVCCLSGGIKCSSVTIATERLRSSFWNPNENFLAGFSVILKKMSLHFSFLLSSLARKPKCSANNHQTVRCRASGFLSPNSLERNSKSSSASVSSVAAWGWLPLPYSTTSCFFLESRTSLDFWNSWSLRMLEFLSFK